ncbi:tetratricopeptide repeat protein [Aequorivita sublithincola DSM 14238]|uniref:Tetratricopeptide repeat protein n=1 Tax=Aequorivita sublithincola (strain DSM 14238 / LMG 21431 / ACAM 643 / 9-3) TaxID=746697 RepID=I3YYI2_AEQSU|nr:tetratricopeptide repeat protein [Aequorivita sublithincola]AFL82050.1 tetratricopeptide repeat protein [Aequorivita sublithincola DSM 14238]
MKNLLLLTISLITITCVAQKQTDPNDIFDEAVALVKNEQWEEAEEKFTTLINLYPDNAELYFKRGYVREMDLKYEVCILDFTRAISLKPGMDLARTNRGFAYRKLGRYEEAIKDFTAEMVINPNPYSYEHRSQVYFLLKDYDNAIADANTAIELKPDGALNYKTRALIYKAKDLKEEACADRDKALSLNILDKYPQYENDLTELNNYCKD